MEIPFTYQGLTGRVMVTLEPAGEPDLLGAWDGARGLANCTATITLKAGSSSRCHPTRPEPLTPHRGMTWGPHSVLAFSLLPLVFC